MSESSGVLFECSEEDCDYETLLFPDSEEERNQWVWGYNLPELNCPECGNQHSSLGGLFGSGSNGIVPVEGDTV